MIFEGNFNVGGKIFNRKLIVSEWMYSAAAVGMIRFFCWHNWSDKYAVEGMNLYYNIEDIIPNKEITGKYEADKAYLAFAEYRFFLEHQQVKAMLDKESWTNEDIKLINYTLHTKAAMNAIFKEIEFDGNNKNEIIDLINKNRLFLIAGLFKNSDYGYHKFINKSAFRKPTSAMCRIWGFYTDPNRKSESMGFSMNRHSRNREDAIEFDYIPFAFSKGRESVFINNNYKIEYLIADNDRLDEFLELNSSPLWHSVLYRNVECGDVFLQHDIEIIAVKLKAEVYETIMLEKEAVEIFNAVSNDCCIDNFDINKLLSRKIEISENVYISIAEEITSRILNSIKLDDLIDKLIKFDNEYFLINKLIEFNEIIYEHTIRKSH